MKKTTKSNLKKSAITASTVLFAIAMTATNIMFDNMSTITTALNQKDYIIEQKGDSENEDKEYVKSKFTNLKDVVRAGFAIQEEEETEGAVLLKNDNNALPLAKGSKVSVFGEACSDPFYGASGSGGINTKEAIDWFDAFAGVHMDTVNPNKKVTGDAYLNVNPKLKESYSVWCAPAKGGGWGAPTVTSEYGGSSSQSKVKIGDVPWNVIQESEGGQNIAQYGDAAIMIIKRTGGEGYDLPATSTETKGDYSMDPTLAAPNDGINGDYLQLNANEKSILEGLNAMKKEGKVKKIVLILNMASTIQLDFLKDNSLGVDACVWAGSVGEVGTVAVTKLLTGEANFSGGLSTTLWYDNLSNPANTNFTDNNYYFNYANYKDFGFAEMNGSYQSSFTSYMVYQEGMYLGYKYTETRYEDYVTGVANVGDYQYGKTVAYPFGYGLSYTNFEFSNQKVVKDGKTYKVSVDVKNTGSVAGKTPVQIYVSKPYGEYEVKNQIQVPSVELVDFGKTSTLAPGKSETVTVNVDEKWLTTYDTFGAGTYVLTEGTYYLTAAQNAHDAVNNILAKKGMTPSNTSGRMDAEGNVNMVYQFRNGLDTKTYSYSSATGNPILNQFGFADINTYEGKGNNNVKYVDRANWDGTVHLSTRDASGRLNKPYEKLNMTQQMANDLRDQMDLEKLMVNDPERNTVDYPTYGAQNGLTLLDLMDEPYESQTWDLLLDQLTWDETVDLLSNGRHKSVFVGSVNKPGSGDENGPNGFNATYKKKSAGSAYAGPTNPLAERCNDPDLESGFTTTGFSSNGILAATYNKDLALRIGEQIGEEGLWAGISGWLGTGLNIQRSPYAGRTAEYFSEDAMLTGYVAGGMTRGAQNKGINCFIKHCAINESETARHGVACWMTEQTMRENYLRAFEMAIEEGGATSVMTSFSRMGCTAVANCVVFSQKFLRGECGLPGILETDCAGDMTDGSHGEAYVSRIANVYIGATDLNEYNYAVTVPDYTGGKYYYADFAPTSAGGNGGYGRLGQQMRESAHRILYTVLHSNAMNGYSSNMKITRITPPWVNLVNGVDIALGCLLGLSVLWYVVDGVLYFVKKDKNV